MLLQATMTAFKRNGSLSLLKF